MGIPAWTFHCFLIVFCPAGPQVGAEKWTYSAQWKVIWPSARHGTPAAVRFFMITLLIITAGLFAAGFFVEVVSAATAPLGYQDERGFHFGRENSEAEAFEIGNPS
jgi:Na+-driven multidrug efflux pump